MRMGSGEVSTMRNLIVCTVHIIVMVIKSIEWEHHVVRMDEDRNHF